MTADLLTPLPLVMPAVLAPAPTPTQLPVPPTVAQPPAAVAPASLGQWVCWLGLLLGLLLIGSSQSRVLPASAPAPLSMRR